MPTKRLDGPVGDFKAIRHKEDRRLLKQHALWPLMIEAIDRHYSSVGKDNPFFCPFSGCSAHFAKAGEWTTHALSSHAQMWRVGEPMEILPDSLRVAFTAKADALKEEKEQVDKHYRRLFSDWNEQGEQRRKELERGWMIQLETDEAWKTGKKARESRLWAEFLEQMTPDGAIE